MYDERWGRELGRLAEQVAAEVAACRTASGRFSQALEGERASVGQALTALQDDLQNTVRGLSPSERRSSPGGGRGGGPGPPEELAAMQRELQGEREQAAQALGGLEASLRAELRGLEELLDQESAGREQARGSISGSMQDAAAKVQEAAQACTREREASHEKLLQLLEATCSRMERHLQA